MSRQCLKRALLLTTSALERSAEIRLVTVADRQQLAELLIAAYALTRVRSLSRAALSRNFAGSADGELGIDPGEAVEELLAKLGVGAQQIGGDDEQTEQLVARLSAAPEIGEKGDGLGEQAGFGEGGGEGGEGRSVTPGLGKAAWYDKVQVKGAAIEAGRDNTCTAPTTQHSISKWAEHEALRLT